MTDAISLSTAAVVMIDLQAWILSMPKAPHDTDAIVSRTARLARRVKAAGGLLVGVRVGFAADYADMLRQPTDRSLTLPPGPFPAAAMDFAPEIAALPLDVSLTKRQWSAFHGTELDLQLRRRKIDTIILGGVMTNFGVESTARDAWQHGYAVVVAEDLCAAPTAEMHSFAVDHILPRIARVRQSDQI